MQKTSYALLLSFIFASFSAYADDLSVQFAREFNVAQTLALHYEQVARKRNQAVTLSAKDGRAFYMKKVVVNGKDLSCSTCHTDNPANPGKHKDTGKPIKPLAISANPEAFSDLDKVEKNFEKHCHELYVGGCSALDKANYLTYIMSVQ